MIQVGLIGLGYWGPNVLRVLNSEPHIHRSRLDIISKYDDQVDEAFFNYELWKNGYSWKSNGECIYLDK